MSTRTSSAAALLLLAACTSEASEAPPPDDPNRIPCALAGATAFAREGTHRSITLPVTAEPTSAATPRP